MLFLTTKVSKSITTTQTPDVDAPLTATSLRNQDRPLLPPTDIIPCPPPQKKPHSFDLAILAKLAGQGVSGLREALCLYRYINVLTDQSAQTGRFQCFSLDKKSHDDSKREI